RQHGEAYPYQRSEERRNTHRRHRHFEYTVLEQSNGGYQLVELRAYGRQRCHHRSVERRQPKLESQVHLQHTTQLLTFVRCAALRPVSAGLRAALTRPYVIRSLPRPCRASSLFCFSQSISFPALPHCSTRSCG